MKIKLYESNKINIKINYLYCIITFSIQMDLEEMKKKIDTLDKEHHIQILKIIKNSSISNTLSENKNGVFVNLSVLQTEIVESIKNYLDYLNQQENLLIDLETKKEDVKNAFFILEKEDKGNSINMFSYQV